VLDRVRQNGNTNGNGNGNGANLPVNGRERAAA
jgi:hypothetical protein